MEEHGSTFPGSPKSHTRENTSQRKLEVLFFGNKTFLDAIFALNVTRLEIGIGKLTMLLTYTSRNSSQSSSSSRPYKFF